MKNFGTTKESYHTLLSSPIALFLSFRNLTKDTLRFPSLFHFAILWVHQFPTWDTLLLSWLKNIRIPALQTPSNLNLNFRLWNREFVEILLLISLEWTTCQVNQFLCYASKFTRPTPQSNTHNLWLCPTRIRKPLRIFKAHHQMLTFLAKTTIHSLTKASVPNFALFSLTEFSILS